MMQDELDAASPPVAIHLIGVNQDGYESGNASFVSGRDLPWLDEGPSDDVWGAWNVTYRDVWVLDGEGFPYAVYNLSEHNLATSANYDELKTILLDAATAEAN